MSNVSNLDREVPYWRMSALVAAVLFVGVSRAGAQGWVNVSLGSGGPTGRHSAAMTYADLVGGPPPQDVAVLFGGFGVRESQPPGPLNDTWHWHGALRTWEQIVPPISPGPRFGHALAFDAARQKVVLFGGSDENGISSETWEYDPAVGNWALVSVVGPSPRRYHAMTYDESIQRVVLFGGEDDGDTPRNDVWVFEGESANWVEASPSGDVPDGRSEHGFTFDPSIGKSVLYGGLNIGGQPLSDTRLLQVMPVGPGGYAALWSQCADAGGGPGPRFGHALTYDACLGATILFSGVPDSAVAYVTGDTWQMVVQNGQCVWSEAPTVYPAAPTHRRNYGLTYDRRSAEVVLFGGQDIRGVSTPFNADTWVLLCLPRFAEQPQSQVVRPGAEATFTVTVTDFPKFQLEYDYRWRKNGVPIVNQPPRITGADTDQLRIEGCTSADDGAYDVVVRPAHPLYLPVVDRLSDPASLSVVPDPGDLNADGVVNGEDIQPFMAALLGPQ